MSKLILIPVRRVSAVSSGTELLGPVYQVFEQENNGQWVAASKMYAHSTQAFAALGRLTQRDTAERLNYLKGPLSDVKQ